MAEQRSKGFVVRTLAITVAVVSAAAGIYHLRLGRALQHRNTSAEVIDTLNVDKGTEKYLVEPGIAYVPVGAMVRIARVESTDGNWFAISEKDGTVYRDCAKEPINIAIASNAENSPYRVKICGSGRHLILTGR
jgi:hypothetical protein